MRGYRRSAAGKYGEIAPHEANRWYSDVLGLELRDEGRELRFRDLLTGEELPTIGEEADARVAAEDRAERAEGRAEAAEARAEQEADARRREAESRRAAEARVAELEALLRTRNHPV